ncbi:MAG TPA: type II secretion system protein [Patescibacteria group bacterium]|nr:type II secretion system protein [Patescibacteria group bacterium]
MFSLLKNLKSNKKTSQRFIKGFSLVEVILVVAIIASLFAVGYANFRGYQRRQSIMAAARQVEGDIRLAEEYASSGKKPTGCTLLNGYIFQVNSSPVDTYDIIADCPTDVVVKNDIAISSGMTLTPSSSMMFKVLGLGTDIPSDNPKTIIVTQTETQEKVDIVITYSGVITVDFE